MSKIFGKLKEKITGKKLEKLTSLEEAGLSIYMHDTLSYRNEQATEALKRFEDKRWVDFMEISNRMIVEAAMAWYTAGSKTVSDRVLRGWYGLWENWCKLKEDFEGDYENYDFLSLAEWFARMAFRVLSKSFFTEHVLPQKPIVIQTMGGKRGPDYIPAPVGSTMAEEED